MMELFENLIDTYKQKIYFGPADMAPTLAQPVFSPI